MEEGPDSNAGNTNDDDDDDDKKLPAVNVAKGELARMRCSYGDAFLDRCHPVDVEALMNNLPLPCGTYICPWMPKDLKEEKWAKRRQRLRCRECGEIVYGSIGLDDGERQDHFVKCVEKLRGLADPLFSKQEKYQEWKELRSYANAVGVNVPKAKRRKIEEQSKEFEPLQRFYDYHRMPFEGVKEDAELEDKSDLSYWAAKCQTKELDLFLAALLRRPHVGIPMRVLEDHGNPAMDFGSHSFQASLLSSTVDRFPGYSPCAIQATWVPFNSSLSPNHNRWDTDPHYRLGLHYTKDAVWMYNQRHPWGQEDDREVYYEEDIYAQDDFVLTPFTPCLVVPRHGVNHEIAKRITTSGLKLEQYGGEDSDVWVAEDLTIARSIKPILDDWASRTNDCPLPRYQMIIDPNQFVRSRKKDQKMVWVPCEFDVSSDGSKATLLGGERAHMLDSTLIDSVATPVLTAALPLLSKLKKPYLLLEGQRLQVVVKAQSIAVPRKQPGSDDSPEYISLWRVDGENEAVAAVVLYYYDVDEALVGGKMEFMDRRPISVLGSGDTVMQSEIPPGALREALRSEAGGAGSSCLIPNCSVATKTGTLLVFSNYQMAHRVLRMVNTSEDRAASRKFVTLFVLDPAADRLVPSRSHLARSYLYQRAVTGRCALLSSPRNERGVSDSLPDTVAAIIMDFMGIIPSVQQRRQIRNELLRSQLLPRKIMGMSNKMVCSNGDGCLTMLGWLDSLLLLKSDADIWWREEHPEFDKAEKRVNALNYPPKEVGRGLSETLSTPTDDLDADLANAFVNAMEKQNEKLNADFDKMHE